MDYRIPMNQLSVELGLKDGNRREADIFLHTVSDAHPGPETVAEFLNSGRSFIPCLLTSTSDPFLCNKETIVLIAGVEDGSIVDRQDESPPTAVHRVRISLAAGFELEGNLHVHLPPENCRVSDFLNDAATFFPVRADGQVTFVNRSFIEEVVPLEEGSRPGSDS